MRKYLIILSVLLAVIAGCASSPPPVAPKVTAPQFVIVDHKNAAWGKEPPEWVVQNQIDLEKQKEFEGNYVFKFEQTGKDLNAVKAWAGSFVAQPEIARIVSTRVQDKFSGALAGDVNKAETYMEQVVKVLSSAEYTGYKKYDDYWVLKSFVDKQGNETNQEYLYVVVYQMPKRVLDELVKRTLESANIAEPAKTEDEKTARDRVKKAMEEGI